MPETILPPDIETPSAIPAVTQISRQRRLIALGVVLSVSFTQFVVTGFYYLVQADRAVQRYHSQIGVFGALASELISLFVLWFVLTEHKRSWSEIVGLLSGRIWHVVLF